MEIIQEERRQALQHYKDDPSQHPHLLERTQKQNSSETDDLSVK